MTLTGIRLMRWRHVILLPKAASNSFQLGMANLSLISDRQELSSRGYETDSSECGAWGAEQMLYVSFWSLILIYCNVHSTVVHSVLFLELDSSLVDCRKSMV